MKQIIIFLLLIIVGIMGFNLYRDWHRFQTPNYTYLPAEKINVNHPDRAMLLDYYQAIEQLNGHVITQWSSERIDVRNPEDNHGKTLAAVNRYRELLGAVKFYENQLQILPKKNEEKAVPLKKQDRKQLIQKMFDGNTTSNQFNIGESSALIYEVQRILIEKGDSIRLDGLFRAETFQALKKFEEKNGLFPDGKLDALTLDYLLQ